MDFTQIVGFLVSMAAIFYMFIKRAQDRRKSSHEHEEDVHQEEKLKDFLRSLEIDMEDSEDFRPPPKPKAFKKVSEPSRYEMPKKEHYEEPKKALQKKESIHSEFKTDLDDFQMRTNIEDRRLKLSVKSKFEDEYGEHLLSPEFRGKKIPHLIGYRKASRISKLLQNLPSKKDMVLLHEILEQPKGFKF